MGSDLAGARSLSDTAWLAPNAAAAFAFPMLLWVPLMGGGVVGGIVLMVASGDNAAVPVAVIITVLGVASAALAGAAIVRPRPDTGLAIPAARPAHQEG